MAADSLVTSLHQRRFGARWLVALPLSFLGVVMITASLAPLLPLHPPDQGDLAASLLPPAWMADGAWTHPLGTDKLGRDILSRIIWGARVSGLVVLSVIPAAAVIGSAVGVMAGYFGGSLDSLMMRIVDVSLSIPTVVLAMALAVIFKPSLFNVVLIGILVLWSNYARQARGATLSVKERNYVALARIAGISSSRIILRHILPNVLDPILVLATLQIGYVILLESALSFLGVGIPPPTPAWGLMVADGRGLVLTAWWVAFFPGLAISLVVFSVNLIGDWLRDALDPRSHTA